MRIASFLVLSLFATTAVAAPQTADLPTAAILDPEASKHYVDFFNGMVPEEVVNAIPDASAWAWMKANIPFFACPDKDVEEVYYYRWWVFRKHIKQTPVGFILTEFLKPVPHATQYNAISSAFGHHVAEGRWLHDPRYLNEYVSFWLRSGQNGQLQPRFHQFSGWAPAAAYDRWLVSGDRSFLVSLLAPLLLDYRTWERDRQLESGLFWQSDVADGMEESVSGGRKLKNVRPSINSYMYGNAKAIAAIAILDGQPSLAHEYEMKAAKLKALVQDRLWSRTDDFFETLLESRTLAPVREQVGFTPWYFDLPDGGRGYETAWKQLMDPKGFYAPYGPTTVEQRNPGFRIADQGDDCQWNGPSWPFATTVTLKALANVLNDYKQNAITKADYFKIFQVYTHSHHLKLADRRVIPWIDEDLNPFTGEWQARAMKIRKGIFYGRGDHYNHSGYADLLISGLVGLRPRADNAVEVNPLVPDGAWDWFCLDNVLYHGRTLTILWDKAGSKFGKGQGLRIFADGRQIAHVEHLTRATGRLPPALMAGSKSMLTLRRATPAADIR